jgi:hypothetical protein
MGKAEKVSLRVPRTYLRTSETANFGGLFEEQ